MHTCMCVCSVSYRLDLNGVRCQLVLKPAIKKLRLACLVFALQNGVGRKSQEYTHTGLEEKSVFTIHTYMYLHFVWGYILNQYPWHAKKLFLFQDGIVIQQLLMS